MVNGRQAEQIQELLLAITAAKQRLDKIDEMDQMKVNTSLQTLNCTPETKAKIYNYLISVGVTKLADLTKQQM